MALTTRMIPLAAAAALTLGFAPPAEAGAGFDPAAVVQVDDRGRHGGHWRRDHRRDYRRGPPVYYAPPPRVYYPPPRVYYPPPPPRYYVPAPRYYAPPPPPGVGLYFRF